MAWVQARRVGGETGGALSREGGGRRGTGEGTGAGGTTHVATGAAVVPAARQGVEGFPATHAHGHHLVPDPLWRPEAQLLGLQLLGGRVGASGPPSGPAPRPRGPLSTCFPGASIRSRPNRQGLYYGSVNMTPFAQVRKLSPETSRDSAKTPSKPDFRAQSGSQVPDTLPLPPHLPPTFPWS